MNSSIKLLCAGTIALATVPLILLVSAHARADGPATVNPAKGANAPVIADSQGVNLRRTVAVEVAEKTKDAVVYISADRIIQQSVSPFGNDPFFRQFEVPGMVQQAR